jgi:hypothetical protein
VFGYIKPLTAELKVCEYELYKSAYCGMCKKIGRSFGPISRLTLTFDAVFLQLVEMAVSPQCPQVRKGRCLLRPLEKKMIMMPNKGSVSPSIGVLLLHYKVLDSISDHGTKEKVCAICLYPISSAFRHRALKDFSHIDEIISKSVYSLRRLEKDQCASIDDAAECFAFLMRDLFSLIKSEPSQKFQLGMLGYHLGRWIYLFDALDDLEDDFDKGNYNPILLHYGIVEKNDIARRQEEILHSILDTMALSLSAAHEVLQQIELYRFRPILDNIIAMGMPGRIQRMLREKGE